VKAKDFLNSFFSKWLLAFVVGASFLIYFLFTHERSHEISEVFVQDTGQGLDVNESASAPYVNESFTKAHQDCIRNDRSGETTCSTAAEAIKRRSFSLLRNNP